MRFGCAPLNYLAPFPPMIGSNTGSFPLCEIQTGATDHFCLEEFIALCSLNSNNNNSSNAVFGIGAPAAAGVGLYPVALSIENSPLTDAQPGISVLTTWTTKPTVPTKFFRRATVSGNVSQNPYRFGIRFTFPNGLRLAPSSSLVLWHISDAVSQVGMIFEVSLVGDG